jgi:thiamine biosynthesis protein ThiI
MASVVVHYQELALKGRNRPWFIDRFVANLREATAGLDVAEVRPLMGRVELVLGPSADAERILDRVLRTFGVANAAVGERVAPDVDAIAATALRLLEGREARSFRVTATRADKRFPLTSPEIERGVGHRIREARGWPVDLSDPALVVRVEILPGVAFCSVERQPGPGGLPVGVSGRVACLLSGGIDSPVAAWRMMKRGCRVLFVHFHSYPIVSTASQEKARRLVEVLTPFQLRSRLLLVPFGEIQRRIVVGVPPPLRVVVYRRFMLRIAERLARRAGARALVTGEALGQVASQTLENIAVIGAAAALPVLRPLVGMDKEEITAEARRLGTYEISILPDEDCCRLFTPAHPATRARLEEVERAEAALAIEEMVAEAAEAAERLEFGPEGAPASASVQAEPTRPRPLSRGCLSTPSSPDSPPPGRCEGPVPRDGGER